MLLEKGCGAYFTQLDSIINADEFINEILGFTCVIWYKLRVITDRVRVDTNSNQKMSNNKNNNNGTQLDNSDISYRIIDLLTSNELLLDPQSNLIKELSKLKLNCTVIHKCHRDIFFNKWSYSINSI